MKKTKLTRTLMAAVSVVALSAVMYGCVHSGGDDSTTQVVDPDPVDVDRKAINDAIDAAEAAISALTAMSSDDDVTAAQGLIDAAQTALDGTTVLPVTEVRTLQGEIDAAQTALGAKQTAIADYMTHQSQYMAATDAVGAAETAVSALTAASADDAVSAADGLVAAAKAAVTAGTMLTEDQVAALNGRIQVVELTLANTKNLIADRKAGELMDSQRMAANNAVDAAEMAVRALTNMSSDDDVTAAQGLIDAAQEVLDGTTALPASEVLALQGDIDAAQDDLDDAETAIANYRTHQSQHTTAMNAVGAATMAVAGLNDMSSDDDVTAAENAIQAAKDAVAAGTMLTASEIASLNGTISTAEMNLGTKKMQIAAYRTHGNQYTAAMNAVNAATEAVGGLNAMSSDADVMAAKMAIKAAEDAVKAGTSLTAAEMADLNGKIAIAKVNLGTAEATIANYRMHTGQLAAANTAVGAAETAVAALDINSSDAAVTDAENKIAAAKTAIEAGTTLTEDEMEALNGRITAAETTLGTVMAQINIRKAGQIAEQIVDLHEDASAAITAARAAGMSAAQAVKDATKYSGMLDVDSVDGDSTKAMMNAQMVLDARAAVTKAVADAEAAKMRAMAAKTKAEAIADGTDGKTEVLAAINAAIKVAEDQIAATKAISTGKDADGSANDDGTALKTAVEIVTGTDEKKPKTATDAGDAVAMAVAGALLPMNTTPGSLDGSPMRVTHYDDTSNGDLTNGTDTITPPAVKDRTFHDNDSRGMTWAMIVGEANVRMERIGTGDAAVPVASIAGMTAAGVDADVTDTAGTDGGNTYADAFSDGDSTYKGISGTIWCLGDDCKVGVAADGTANVGKLLGSWYFTPDEPDTPYIQNPDATARAATPYVEDTLFAQWGHWLAVDEGTGEVTVHTYATSGANTADLELGVTANMRDTSATYTGDAVGMSVHKGFNTDGKQTSINSGAFTADVTLTAEFGSAPMLGGKISNFQGGAHVDSGWSVMLEKTALDITDADLTDGVAMGTGQAGVWTAQGYGPEPLDHDSDANTPDQNQRPTGFFGSFNAHFTDGHAAGAYVTQK